MVSRYLTAAVMGDLKRKMVFLGGPRQAGKTTLAHQVLKDFPYGKDRRGRYFDWDDDGDRSHMLKREWGDDEEVLVFDELHKFRRWKTWLKGIFDRERVHRRLLVTGSARLDVYRRGGDSLIGRYHYWRLHPFTLSEIPKGIAPAEAFKRLMTVGGFPEPFLDGNEREARRWRKERFDRILRDDIRDLERLHEITTLDLFAQMLRTRVGGLVVLNNMATELQVSPKTVKHWLEILEKMYVVFVVKPLTAQIPRAVLKPPKVYFFDNADVIGDDGARFENLVATTLLKRLHYLEDAEGYRYELRYIRDKEGREVDFAILKDGVVEELVEVKHTDPAMSRSLLYYADRLQPKRALQIVGTLKTPLAKGRLRVEGPFDSLAAPLIVP